MGCRSWFYCKMNGSVQMERNDEFVTRMGSIPSHLIVRLVKNEWREWKQVDPGQVVTTWEMLLARRWLKTCRPICDYGICKVDLKIRKKWFTLLSIRNYWILFMSMDILWKRSEQSFLSIHWNCLSFIDNPYIENNQKRFIYIHPYRRKFICRDCTL